MAVGAYANTGEGGRAQLPQTGSSQNIRVRIDRRLALRLAGFAGMVGLLDAVGGQRFAGVLGHGGTPSVGALPSGMETPHENQIAERVNVQAFGAVGDGITDDSVAIQRAIDAVSANGGVVYFPAGTYLIRRQSLSVKNRNGLSLEGESRFGTALLNGVTDGDLITFDNCQMIGIENFEIYQSGRKTTGAYIRVTNSHMFHGFRLRLQNPYQGLLFDGIGGAHLYDVKFVPQNVTWPWASAIHIQKSAGIFASNIDVNFGQNLVELAAIVIEGGSDTIYFVNGGANQIGGKPGDTTGGDALRIQNTNGSFDPRWVRFTNFAFESAGGQGVSIAAANDAEFIGAYSVNSRNALSISGGSNIKWLGGVLAATSQHVVELRGGQDIIIDRATIASGSWEKADVYSGVSVGPRTDRVSVTNCNIGDTTTIPEYAGKMAYGVSIENTDNDKRHMVRNNIYGPQVSQRVYNGSPTSSVQTRRDTEGVSPPEIGTWEPGDYVRNIAPTELGLAGQKFIVTGWRCITSGAPGTWVAENVQTGN